MIKNLINKNTVIAFLVGVLVVIPLNYSLLRFDGDRMIHGMHKMPDGSAIMNDRSKMNMKDDMGEMSMNEMSEMMKGKSGKDLEREFIKGMIPHHRGAVEMAKVLLADKAISLELRTFAENIIKAQDAEIVQMNEWLKKY
jgi:uncharacterized protein (DUF305 family)